MGEEFAVKPKEALTVGPKSLAARIFGQFITKDFWLDLTKHLLQQAISNFLIGLGRSIGGTLDWYGKKTANQEIVISAQEQSSASNRAFGGGFTPNPSYNSSSHMPSYPVPSSAGDGRFPGFSR